MVRKASSRGSVALIALTVLALVGLAGYLGSKATQDKTLKETEVLNGSKNGTLLRLKPLEDPLTFHLVRQERTLMNKVPQYKKNFDLSFDLTIEKTSKNDYQIKPSNGNGLDLDKKQSNHLKKMAAIISEGAMSITLAENGAASDPLFIEANDAGWAGAMALKALGMFEHGFLETMLPNDPIEQGAKWSRYVDYAEEEKQADANASELFPSLKKSIKFVQTGPEAEYTLVKIESVEGRQIAEITYNSSGTVSVDSKHPLMGDASYQQEFTEKGTIKLDVKTSWPIEFKMVRTVETKSATVPSIEEYTTHVKRI
jgi:hypothetical protein